jgi:hypothetical protein
MFNPIVSILFNQKLNRWHPILFIESPLPGPDSPEKPVRHKSKGHHTEGFDKRDDAIEGCNELATNFKKHYLADVKLCVEKDFAWDGEGVPAMVVYFEEQNGKVVPMIV